MVSTMMKYLKSQDSPDKAVDVSDGALTIHDGNVSCSPKAGHGENSDLRANIQKLRCRLYYINHKQEINQNRKKYKRQTWAERADNPKNKEKKNAKSGV